MNIELILLMCPETGKPYYYGTTPQTGSFDRMYGIPDVKVPVDLKKYLGMRGSFFHHYTQGFEEKGLGYSVEVEQFLDDYPSWDDILDSNDDIPDYWSKDDHTGFKQLLEWCRSSGLNFNVRWSY